MKEKIYTIPLNEAFETNCECALCHLEKQLEKEAVEYSLGAAMMEPDFRIESNEKGFCNAHYSMMFSMPNKLSLALILDTHLEELSKKFDSLSQDFDNLTTEKNKLFKKTSVSADKISEWFNKNKTSCVICDKVNTTMKRYIEVFFYMWTHDENFKNKVVSSKGFCLSHFDMLFENSFKYLNKKEASEFLNIIYKKEKEELGRIREDIHKFTLKFDYRNKDMEWGTAIDAPKRTIEKISGYIPSENSKEN